MPAWCHPDLCLVGAGLGRHFPISRERTVVSARHGGRLEDNDAGAHWSLGAERALRRCRPPEPVRVMPAKGVVDMTELSNLVAESVERLRRDKPLVQCLTNIVVANFTANVLLSAGAVPAMVDNPEESEGFASIADGVLVNTGTPYRETTEAMIAAARGAASSNTPWVLDPVGSSGRTPLRCWHWPVLVPPLEARRREMLLKMPWRPRLSSSAITAA